MKKIFEQPEMTVVCMNNSDIVTLSTYGVYDGEKEILAPGQRSLNDWDAGY